MNEGLNLCDILEIPRHDICFFSQYSILNGYWGENIKYQFGNQKDFIDKVRNLYYTLKVKTLET